MMSITELTPIETDTAQAPPAEQAVRLRDLTATQWKSGVAAWLGQQPGYGAVRPAFATTHPRQLFQGDSLATSLKQAGLVPRGVLVLEK